ncbi:MAG TPA: hypothetical protein VF771_12870, partial [Longimicrobiaceae bacterium]
PLSRRTLSVLTLATMLAACGGSAPNQAERGDRAPAPFEPRTIEIVDYWEGLEPQGPIEAVYHLERQGESHTFSGTGTLTQARRRTSGPLPVTIPDSAVEAFLRALAAAPRAPGEYVPRIEHTDDYPHLTIRLRSDTSVVEFYSESQGQERRPWRVTVGGRRYVSDSAAPAQAMRHIQPYLRRAELDRVVVGWVGADSPAAR